jgi:YfiH family protein
MSAAEPLTAPLFAERIVHGFFGRAGGVSEGLYRGLKCGFGSGDEAEKVTANRARVAQVLELTPDRLLTVFQTHSADVLTVTALHEPGNAPAADAMVTVLPEIGLAILTADCAPVLLADEAAGVIGAAHAGWKGAIGGVLENTVAAMIALGARAKTIRAAIGPTISQANYEVGAEFSDRFIADDPANKSFFKASQKDKHFQFDLPGYCAGRLKAAGVIEICDLAQCTYADEDSFYSYRRATHKQEPDYGRNISVVVLRP